MDPQPTTVELKQQALMILAATLPPDTRVDTLDQMAMSIVSNIEKEWNRYKQNQVRAA